MYDRKVKDQELTFGVSGRLYNSNVLFYDHQTESLWSQIREEAVTGPLTGTRLRALPSVTTTWKAWKKAHPSTLVLSTKTGFRRDYSRDPYQGYARSPMVMFPVKHLDPRLHPKERVVGVRIGEKSKAYVLSALKSLGQPLKDKIGDQEITLTYDPEGQSATVTETATGKPLPAVSAYWFAWVTFHPQTEVYGAPVEASRMLEGSH